MQISYRARASLTRNPSSADSPVDSNSSLAFDLIDSIQEEAAMAQQGPLGRWMSSTIFVAAALALACPGYVRAQEPAAPKTPKVALPRIEANRNLTPAGQLRDGVLALRLEIREGDWYP